MPSPIRFSLFFCLTLLALVLSSSILSAHAVTSYLPAVTPGQLVQYGVLYDKCQSTDPSVCESMGSSLNDTRYAALQVIAVSGPAVTLQLITIYKNGTGSREGAIVDVATGSSNVTSLSGGAPGNYFVLAGNLQVSDHIWDDPSAPTFNSTTTKTILGSPRLVNFLNYSSSFSYPGSSFSTSSGFAFDQASGVLVEVSFSITTTGYPGDIQINFALGMVDNNIWGTANLPDFGLSADPMTVNIVGSATGTSTISLTRSPGFSATVKLTATSSSSSVTCSLSSNSLAMGGSDTSTLSCAGPSGTYTVTIEGNGGYSIHDTSVTVGITSNTNPDFTISNNGPISFQTGSSGTATITINAQNSYSSPTDLEVSSTPSGLTCSLSSNSVSGYGSVTLTCSGQPGSYTVTVEATGGGSSHSTQTAVTVSTAPTTTQPASSLPMPVVYGGIGVAAVVAALVAFLFLRRKPSGAVVATGEPQAPVSQA